MRIAKLHQEYNIDLKYTLFPLHPYVPDEGMTLEELFKGRNFDLKAVQQHIRNLAAEEGLDYGERSNTYNSRLAQELAKWAETQPNGSGIHNRLYRAYFYEGTNLANIEALADAAEEIGLDRIEAKKTLENREFQEHVDADWNRCRKIGVMAVPTYLCNGRNLIGAQSYEGLVDPVVSAGAKARDQ